ncbi:hypothetical protein MKW92_004260, partial [Papaver armeniacum]
GPAYSPDSGYFGGAGDIPNAPSAIASSPTYILVWFFGILLLLGLLAAIFVLQRRTAAARAASLSPLGTPSPRLSPSPNTDIQLSEIHVHSAV